MATFQVTTKTGAVINVPDFAKLNIQDMTIIGDETPDWNEPIQQNLIKLSNRTYEIEDSIVAAVSTKADIGTSYTKAETDAELAKKQLKLTAGSNINITEAGVISSSIDLTEYVKKSDFVELDLSALVQ